MTSVGSEPVLIPGSRFFTDRPSIARAEITFRSVHQGTRWNPLDRRAPWDMVSSPNLTQSDRKESGPKI